MYASALKSGQFSTEEVYNDMVQKYGKEQADKMMASMGVSTTSSEPAKQSLLSKMGTNLGNAVNTARNAYTIGKTLENALPALYNKLTNGSYGKGSTGGR